MSATDELRRLLDERGVEWKEHRHIMPGSMAIQRETLWGQPTDAISGRPIPHVYHYRATEMGDGRLFLEAQLIAPEQAIAATLGDGDATGGRQGDAGTCHDTHEARWFRCSACGFGIEDMYVNDEDEYPPEDQPRYCPNCGRLVVEVDE